jgi:hypothetical protein
MFGSLETQKLGRALAGGFIAMLAISAARADDLPGAFHGNAYATSANVKAGSIAASLANSAFQGCPCNGTDGQTLTSEVDDISAGNVLSANKTLSTAFTSKTASTAQVENTASVNGLNMLGGLITADGIDAVAAISATAASMTSSTEGSGFRNLVIAGQSVPADVPPNTTIPVPGIGSVTLNKITTKGAFKKGGEISVEMLTLAVNTRNNLGLPLGAKIVLAHAAAGFVRVQPDAVYDGQAFVAQAGGSIGNDLRNKIGRAALLNIDCLGTAGKTLTNSVANVDGNGLLSMEGGMTTAFAGPEGDAFVSRTTTSGSSFNLLGGLIKVDGLQAVAQSSLKDGVATGSADGSGFTGLTVAGIPVPVTTPPNTKLNLPLLGNLVVNEQTVRSDGSVTVNGLHIHITTANLLGLPVGTELTVAHASASVAPF